MTFGDDGDVAMVTKFFSNNSFVYVFLIENE